MTTQRKAAAAAGTLLILAIAVTAAFWAMRHPGRDSALEAAASYVAAMQAGSPGALSAVADPDADSGPAISAALRQVGTGPLIITSVVLQPTESDHMVAFDLIGTLKEQPYSSRIFARKASGGPWGWRSGWYVVLGAAPGSSTPPERSSTP